MFICSSLTSGDSGQLSGSKLSLAVASKLRRKEGEDVPPRQLSDDGSNSRKTSDSGVGSHSPSPDLGSDSEKEGGRVEHTKLLSLSSTQDLRVQEAPWLKEALIVRRNVRRGQRVGV